MFRAKYSRQVGKLGDNLLENILVKSWLVMQRSVFSMYSIEFILNKAALHGIAVSCLSGLELSCCRIDTMRGNNRRYNVCLTVVAVVY